MVTNIILGIVLSLIFFITYFDRELKNHAYLCWYGAWILFVILEIKWFCISPIGNILLLKAAKTFSGKKMTYWEVLILMLSFLQVRYPIIGSIPALYVFAYNYIVLKEYKMKLALLISWMGWAVLEFKYFYSVEVINILASTLFLVTGLVILLVHLKRLQSERDIFKLALQKRLATIDKLETELLALGEIYD